jgi:acyl-CoA hydrolase
MPTVIAADLLPGLLRPGMTVFVQACSSEPTTLIEALKAAPAASAGVHYLSCQLPGLNRTDFAGWHPEARSTSLFLTPETIGSYQAGKVRYMPLGYTGMNAYLAAKDIDLALIQVRPAKNKGTFTLGSTVHFVPTVLNRCRMVVAEVNEALPRPGRSVDIAEERLDHLVMTDHPLLSIETSTPSATSRRIGEHIAGLVQDGDRVQVGIGKVPSAVLAALRSHRRLTCEGGIVSEQMIDLAEAGALASDRPLTCTSVLGTRRLYDWVDQRDSVHVLPVGVTHDVRRLAALDNFVAINSVLSVDLGGQANAETLGGQQIGGSGGLTERAFDPGPAVNRRSRPCLEDRRRSGPGCREQRACGRRLCRHRARRCLPSTQIARRARRGTDRHR